MKIHELNLKLVARPFVRCVSTLEYFSKIHITTSSSVEDTRKLIFLVFSLFLKYYSICLQGKKIK